MTTTNIIEKRRKNLEQRKNKLKQLEISLNAQERKKRTRRLIEIGGLVAKANIEDWSANTLLGAFLFLKEKENDKKQMDNWTHKGGAAFAEEAKQKRAPSKMKGSPVIVKFKSSLDSTPSVVSASVPSTPPTHSLQNNLPSQDIKDALKALGLKWNPLRKEWEGYADVEEVREVLQGHKAVVKVL